MKERVFAAVREMKREQWLICGLAGLLLLVIAAPVKQKEQKRHRKRQRSRRHRSRPTIRSGSLMKTAGERAVAGRGCGCSTGGGGDGIYREETGGKDSPEDTSTSSEKKIPGRSGAVRR